MTLLDHEKAQITTLDAGEAFIAGRYHSLVPIMQEIYENDVNYQYAVTVIKKDSLQDVNSLYDLRHRKACFAGVGTLAGWVIPINTVSKIYGFFFNKYNICIYNKKSFSSCDMGEWKSLIVTIM